jgi:hypothetical protein
VGKHVAADQQSPALRQCGMTGQVRTYS